MEVDQKWSAPAALKWTGALIAAHWVQVPGLVRTLLMLMALDYVSGLSAAFVTGELCSRKGLRGLVKKCMVLLILAAVHVGEQSLGLHMGVELESVIALGYSANELVSLVENCARAGVPIPSTLVAALMKTKSLRAKATAEDLGKLEG